MMTPDALTEFFGWCTILNTGLLLFSTIILILFREPVTRLHGRLMGIDPETLAIEYLRYLGYYKLAIIIFNLAPYLALKIIL